VSLLLLCRHAAADDSVAEFAARVASYAPEAVYSSPLDRALRTAKAISEDLRVDERLREIDFGAVEGLGFDELPDELRRGLLEHPTRVRFPRGESYADLRARVVEALDEIVSRHRVVAAVSHAGAIRAALATWLLMSDEAIWRIDQRYASLNVVEFVDGTPIVRLVNG